MDEVAVFDSEGQAATKTTTQGKTKGREGLEEEKEEDDDDDDDRRRKSRQSSKKKK